jgi:hypothetical protein
MDNYGLARMKISHVMNQLAKQEPLPRLENIYRIAAKAIHIEFRELGTTKVIQDSMAFFLRECKHPVNHSIFESDIENLTSANVVQFYINDSEFFSKKANVLQTLCFMKEALINEDLFDEPFSLDKTELFLRDIDCHVPAVMNDFFQMQGIQYTKHESLDTPRPNTEVLFSKVNHQ